MKRTSARTTLNLDASLVRQAKKRAAQEGRTFTAVVEEALRGLLNRRPPRNTYRLRWITKRGTTAPSVDIADRDALYDRMEGRG